MTAAPKSSVTQLQTLWSHHSCLQEGKEQPPSLRSMRQTQNTPSALLRMIDDSSAAEVCDIWFHSLIRLCLSEHLLFNVSRAPTKLFFVTFYTKLNCSMINEFFSNRRKYCNRILQLCSLIFWSQHNTSIEASQKNSWRSSFICQMTLAGETVKEKKPVLFYNTLKYTP